MFLGGFEQLYLSQLQQLSSSWTSLKANNWPAVKSTCGSPRVCNAVFVFKAVEYTHHFANHEFPIKHFSSHLFLLTGCTPLTSSRHHRHRVFRRAGQQMWAPSVAIHQPGRGWWGFTGTFRYRVDFSVFTLYLF